MTISLKQLQLFVMIAQTGSLSNAAEKVYMTQPAASMSLKQLEQQLQHPLFDRKGKQLLLNDFGKKQLLLADEIIDKAQAFKKKPHLEAATLDGSLNISCSQTIGNYILPSYLAQFKKQHPQVIFNVTIENSHDAIQKILQMKTDIALIESPLPTKPMLAYNLFSQDKLEFVVRKNHPLTKKKHVSLTDLEQYAWVLREPGSGTADYFDSYMLDKMHVTEEIVLNSFEAAKAYIIASDCIAYMSSAAVKDAKELVALKVKGVSLERPLHLIWHNKKYRSALFNQFLNIFQ